MTTPKAFRFYPIDVGLATQKIVFVREGDPEQRFDIPDMTLPEDTTDRFWALYNKLFELNLVENKTPTFEV